MLSDSVLSDYLSRLHTTTDSVRLLGDSEERGLADVFVDMDVSVADERRTPILRDLLRRPLEEERDDEAGGDTARAELLLELSARADRSDGSLVTASRTLELGPRVLLTGVAGAGKTTLLRWLASEVARSAELVPVWVPHLPALAEDLASELAKLALEALEMPAHGEARAGLADAILTGRAQLLLDGLDEAPDETRATLLGRLAQLGPGLRVIVATRPLGETPVSASGFVRARLLGLRAGGTEAFLRRYFGDAPWAHELVRDLFAWPGAEPWQNNPALLSLAASLYRRGKKLSGSAIDLYEAAIHALMTGSPEGGDPASYTAVRSELVEVARGMFAPDRGTPRALVRREEVSPRAQQTGLLRGGAWLRFAHLSLGEYLAASAPLDLGAERARFRTTGPTALELLPMAHALRGRARSRRRSRTRTRTTRTITACSRSCCARWRSPGERAKPFAKAHAGGLVRRVAERLGAASGRFGPAEEALAEHAERALLVLRSELTPEDGAPLRALTASLGNVGAEANVLLWTAGLGEPVRRSAHGKAARRVGAALVRARMDVSWIVAHTGGEKVFFVRAAAVQALANDPEARPLLRERLTDDDPNVRAAAVQALANDPESRPLIRERLADEDVDVKAGAIAALADDADSRPLIRERLKDNEPTDNNVRSAAILALASDPASYPLLRERLSDRSGTVRVAAFQALAKDPESWALLREKTSDMDYNVRAAAFQALANDPSSLPMLRERLAHESYAVRAAAVGALASDPSSLPMLRERLRDESWNVRAGGGDGARGRCGVVAADPRPARGRRQGRPGGGGGGARERSGSRARRSARSSATRRRARARVGRGREPGRRAAGAGRSERAHEEPRARRSGDPRRGLPRARDGSGRAHVPSRAARRRRPRRERRGVPGPRERSGGAAALASAAVGSGGERARGGDEGARERSGVAASPARAARRRGPERAHGGCTGARERSGVAGLVAGARAGSGACGAGGGGGRAGDRSARARAPARSAGRRRQRRAGGGGDGARLDPEARPLLRDRLEDSAPTVRVAAVRGLAGDPESRVRLRERLLDRAGTVRAAAVYAVMSDPESWELLRDRLEDDDDLGPSGRRTGEVIRAAAVTALARDPSARPLLVERLSDAAPTVRAAAVYALARDPGARALVRTGLFDKASGVRAASAYALCATRKVGRGVPLAALESDARWAPAFRAARAGQDLRAFDEGGAEAQVALWLVRLGWAGEGGRLGPAGRVLGEIRSLPGSLAEGGDFVVRIRMSAEDLPKERLLHPLHNLMEVWQLARQARLAKAASFWLACADVDFDDLVPPAVKPGEVHWGPTFWGFALAPR